MLLLALLLSSRTLLAAEDWTHYRVTVDLDGAASTLAPTALGGAPRRYVVMFPVAPGRDVPLLVEEDPGTGGHRGRDQVGFTAALDGAAREAWRLVLGPASGRGTLRAAGHLASGTRAADGTFVEADRRQVTLTLAPRATPRADARRPGPGAAAGLLATADLAGEVPPGLTLVPGVGAPAEELLAAFEHPRPDELTLVYWNLGKGEHRAVGPRVPLAGGASLDGLDANVRAIAARLRPDLLCLAEVSEARDGHAGTLGPETQAVLDALYPGRLWVPAIFEFARDNNHAIYARHDLVHVAGEERVARPDGGFDARPWRLPQPPAPGERLATVATRWLDWTPPGVDLAGELAWRRAWTKRSDWHTRASVRVDLTLQGQRCAIFPLHLAMPWLELEPTAVRGGFLVDGVQDHQLHRPCPLYHQVGRLREDLARVEHARLLLLGDTNIARRPRPMFPPLRLDDAAAGDGAPGRATALAFERLAQGLLDAFEGDDDAFSFPSPASADPRVHLLPRRLIDNVLHGAGLEVRYRAVFFPRGADHGALAVKVRLRAPGAPLVRPRPSAPQPAADDVEAPRVEVTAPPRGALVPVGAVEVAGRVTDPSGVAWLKVGDAEVALGPDGAFRHLVPVRPGLNVIEVSAADGAGNEARGWRAVIGGQPRAEGPVEDALALRLDRAAFDAAALEAAARLGTVDVGPALRARNPLLDAPLKKGPVGVHVKVEARDAGSGPPTVALEPEPGGLRVRAGFPAVSALLLLEGRPQVWRWSPRAPIATTTRLSARHARVEALARVTVTDGRLTTRLDEVRVSFDGLEVEASLLPAFARPHVARAVEGHLAALLVRRAQDLVPPALDRALAAAAAPRAASALGRPVTLSLAPRRVSFDRAGASLLLAADVVPAGPAAVDVGTHTGSLATPGGPPEPAGRGLALDDDLLNRLGHAAWRAGALHLTVTPADAPRLGLPAWTTRLDAGFLAGLLPEAVAGLPPATPLVLEVAPLAPPIFRPRADGALEVGLGDLVVRVHAAPGGQPRRLVVQASVQALVACAADVDEEGRLTLRLAGRPDLRADVFDGPLPALRQAGLEALLELALPQALEALVRRASGWALPLPGALRGARVTLGARGGALTVDLH
ncbi:MAG: hypothetical protein M9894_35555 [Planctomycetes bacterium]|nr:hypothetical protein [Planctomycetota bacterium]